MARRVQFVDTDMAGIMHFTAFYRMMEETEHAFYRELGFSVHEQVGDESRGFPRVATSCQFKSPLRFEDTVDIHLLVKEIKPKTIEYTFIFRKDDGENEIEVARGSMTVIYVIKVGEQPMRAATIPESITQKLEQAPASLLQE